MKLFIRFWYFYVLWFNVLGAFVPDWGTLNICVIPNSSTRDNLRKQCYNLEKITKQKIKCVFAVDRLRCLEEMMNGTADFGVFKAEDLLIMTAQNHTVNDLVVTNEFRFIRDQPYEFEMVVLVSNEVEINSLADLRDKRLCHPGFDQNGWISNDWSEIFSQYFEEVVVPEQCDPKLSVFENRLKSLYKFFGPSCKPGPWSTDLAVDVSLKVKYHNLCEKCNNPNQCSQRDVYWGRTGPMLCLTDGNGDVAWLRLDDVRTSFKPQQPEKIGVETQPSSLYHNVSFLCPDGTKQPIDSVDPCVWISHPWPLIVSRKSTSNSVSKLINFVSDSHEIYDLKTWEYLLRVLFNMSFQPIKMISPTPILDYLKQIPGFLFSSSLPKCKGSGDDRTISICVPNKATLDKCQLLSNVALVYSIEPGFSCIVSQDCLHNVSKGEADVTIISTEKLRKAYEKKNLKTVLYQSHYDYGSLRQVAAVVRKNSKIHNLQDLKGKTACFTDEDGVGWNSFLMALKRKSLIEDDCHGASTIKKFFSNVCIIDSKPGDVFPTCFPDDEVKPSGVLEINEALGLRCITEGGGDVAFINYNALGRYLQDNPDLNTTVDDYTSICVYEDSSSYGCHLSWASYGQVLVRENLTREREYEIVSAFVQVNSLFGDDSPSSKNSPIFKLFSHNQHEKHILFQSSATKLEKFENYVKRGLSRANNYEIKLKKAVDKCSEKAKPNKSVISFPVIEIYVFQIILIYISKRFVCL